MPGQQDLATNLELEQGGNNDTQTALLRMILQETKKHNLIMCQIFNVDYSAILASDLDGLDTNA